jgi:hypothetical protein
LARTGHAGFDQHALGLLPHHHPGDGHALIALVLMPGDQLVLMKLGLGIQRLLLLKHVYTTLPIYAFQMLCSSLDLDSLKTRLLPYGSPYS